MDDTNENLTIQALKQLDNGSTFTIIVVIRKISRKMSKVGNPFLQVEAGDAVDSFNFNCFEGSDAYLFFQKPSLKCPQIVKINGVIDFYADKLSPRVKTIEEVTGDLYETWLENLVEKPDESLASLKADLEALIQKIQNP